MSLEQEIREQIENIKKLKMEVGNINNHLSALEGMCREDKQKWIDEAYKEGREAGIKDGMCDAWEAAKKIFGHEIDGGLDIDELKKAFGSDVYCTADIIRTNTAEQAIAKLKAYEEHKDDSIEVGDEVRAEEGHVFVVTGITDKGSIYGFDKDGMWLVRVKDRLRKTGKHYDIQSILEEMKNG